MEDKNRGWVGETELALSEVLREIDREGVRTNEEGELLDTLRLGPLAEMKRGIRNGKK